MCKNSHPSISYNNNGYFKLLLFIDRLEIDNHRLTTVLQENAVLKSELEMLKIKYKGLLEENRRLKQASVNIVSYIVCCIILCSCIFYN